MPVLGGGGGTSPLGGTFEATASGAISDGDPVVLNTDGTVSAVSATGATVYAAGIKMYVMGNATDTVYEYDLSTGYDVSTASYLQSFNPLSVQTDPRGLSFSPDGTKMFITGTASDSVERYSLSSAWDISTAVYDQTFSVAAQETECVSLAFNPDGTKMFVLGNTGDDVNEYALGTGFDLSTASYSQNFSVSAQETFPTAIAFKPDGTKMFILGGSGDDVNEYDLSVGFDISTASYSQNFSVSAQDVSPYGLAFSDDGTKMFVTGTAGDDVNEYDLSVAWDISTAVYAQNFSLAAQDSTPANIFFNDTLLGTNLSVTNVSGYGNFLGFADGSYADGATATIQVVGAINESQSGLLAGYRYYIQTDGTLSTTAGAAPGNILAGYALAPTKLLIRGAYEYIVG